MTTYYMAAYRPGRTKLALWEKYKSQSLRGAKCKASRKYGSGPYDLVIVIADKARVKLVAKWNSPNARWRRY